MIPDEFRSQAHHETTYPVPPIRGRISTPVRSRAMNDTLFPAPHESDRDRIEGLRAMRGIGFGLLLAAFFFAGLIVGAFL